MPSTPRQRPIGVSKETTPPLPAMPQRMRTFAGSRNRRQAGKDAVESRLRRQLTVGLHRLAIRPEKRCCGASTLVFEPLDVYKADFLTGLTNRLFVGQLS